MARSAQKTHIFFVDDEDTIHRLECPTGITIPRATKEQLQTTCLESEDHTYIPGLGTPPTLSITANFNPAYPTHAYLWRAQESGEVLRFIVGLSDGDAVPTLDSSGEIDLPPSRSFVLFDGYVSDTPLDAQVGALYTIDFTIQMSGNSFMVEKTT